MTASASQGNTKNNPASDLTFDQWLNELRAEASLRGISAETLDVALSNLEAPIPRVIELDNNQPEFVQTSRDT